MYFRPKEKALGLEKGFQKRPRTKIFNNPLAIGQRIWFLLHSLLKNPAMNHNPFLITPPRACADESPDSSGVQPLDSSTRRKFLKRTGGATVGTLVAWNLTRTNAAAEGETASSYMCGVNPGSLAYNPCGYYAFPNGGYIFLHYKDDNCSPETPNAHRKEKIYTRAEMIAEAWIPQKDTNTPWWFPANVFDENKFMFSGSNIIRIKEGNHLSDEQIITRSNLGGLPAGSTLALKIKILSATRNSTSIVITARAWLEGQAGAVEYTSDFYAEGTGTSVVVKNQQAAHGVNNCNVSL
jgi:hypothetical protein